MVVLYAIFMDIHNNLQGSPNVGPDKNSADSKTDGQPGSITPARSQRDSKTHACGLNVVWQGHDGTDDEIFLYNTATAATTKLTNNSENDKYPQVRGSNTVWQGYDGSNSNIFLMARTVCMSNLSADLNGDCRVDLLDFVENGFPMANL
jgi:hypothetical protein